jgi:Protein of unknown function (DUF1822)
MTSFSLDLPELYAFDALPDRAVLLTDAQIQQAQQASQAVATDQAWQTYCDRLAQFGLVNWLAENNLVSNAEAEIIVRDFVVRSQFVSASEDEFVTVAKAKTPAHFYALTTVAEEQGQVWISGFLSQEQMDEQFEILGSKQEIGEIPLSAFNPKVESLLLALRLTDAAPLSNPESKLTQQVVNLRNWLTQKIDATLEKLDGWETLNGTSNNTLSASGLRGSETTVANTPQLGPNHSNHDLPQILQSLARKGIRLADSSQGMSRVLQIAPIPLRLYIVPGDATEQGEWELLVVLESATDEPMPSGLMLRIRDDENILLEQKFDPQVTTDRSLFAEVVSALDESVFVEIVLPNGKVHSLPKFVFQDV